MEIRESFIKDTLKKFNLIETLNKQGSTHLSFFNDFEAIDQTEFEQKDFIVNTIINYQTFLVELYNEKTIILDNISKTQKEEIVFQEVELAVVDEIINFYKVVGTFIRDFKKDEDNVEDIF